MRKPKFYECGICGHKHPWAWNGDCRDDANRFTDEQLEQKHGAAGFVLVTMEDRVEADEDGCRESELDEMAAD